MAIVYCSWATGDDTTGTGTAANPYKTITKASTSRTAGDEVRVAKSPDPTALTGTTAWTLNGTTVTGTDTLFTTELAIGDFISAPDGGWYEVITISSNTSATLYKKYPSATASGHTSQKLGVTDTGAGANYTAVQTVNSSGDSSTYLYISGGWDLSTETQTGQTYFRQMHGTFATRYGYGLHINIKYNVHVSRLHFLRYQYGINLNTGGNVTLVSPICNSNLYGIQVYAFGSTFIDCPTCNSNNESGLYLAPGTNNNIIVSPTCNSNPNGIHIAYSHSNYFISPTVKSNSYGIVVDKTAEQYIFGTLTTANNSTSAIKNTYSNIYISKASIAESTAVSDLKDYANGRVYINDMGGQPYIYTDNGNIVSQNATAGGTGREWKFSPTNAIRNSVYPLWLPMARFAVASSGQVTITAYFKKSGTGVAGALRCRYGQVTWSDAAQDIVVNCPNNTSRNQVTLQFTPTEAGVVEVEALAWYVSSTTQTVIVDDIAISQT